jgi:sirohydrochlorin ferrochelatase
LAGQAGEAFDLVDCAFLELAEPSIPDGIQRCIDAGASQVTVLPYFLSAGRHVAEDIPAEVRIKQQERPEVDIRIADYLGGSAEIPALLLQTAVQK